MDALLRRLLRPGRRATRTTVALALVALVGWLGVSATHLHLPDPRAHAHTPVAQAGADGHGHAHDHAHGPGPGDERGEARGHGPCFVCIGLERGAPAATPTLAADLQPLADAPVSSPTVLDLAQPVASAYRSRAPPSA